MRLNIIGCGGAGGTVAAMLAHTGLIEIGQILNRSLESAEKAARALGAGTAVTGVGAFDSAELWLISTPDGEIANCAEALASARGDLEGKVVFHLSGRFGPGVLDAVAGQGGLTAAVHPVRSMPRISTHPAEFEGTVCVAEGSPAALAALEPAFAAAGAGWCEVAGLERGLYHAALSIISNVTKGVIWKSQHWLEAAGLAPDDAAEISHSLLSITTEDLFHYGVRHSITGPIVRGDTSTVESHLEALAQQGDHDAEIYRVLARTVLELANERGDLDDATLRRFEELLSAPG